MIPMNIRTAEDMRKLAAEMASKLEASPDSATVFGLKGDLGAGKTTFVQGLGAELGVEGPMQSPTFVIEKRYKISRGGFERLIHIDAYRLEGGRELERLGWRDTVSDPGNLVLIEWPELVADAMPEDAGLIRFEHADDGSRNVYMNQNEEDR